VYKGIKHFILRINCYGPKTLNVGPNQVLEHNSRSDIRRWFKIFLNSNNVI